MAFSTSQTTVNREKLHREALQILTGNFLHFFAISLLFLPLTFSASAAFQSYFSFDPPTLTFIKTIIASSSTLLSVQTLIILLAFTIFVILPTVAGVALITYTTNQAIHHKPLTFSSTVKSLSHSFIPLFSTILSGSITLILLSLLFTLSAFAATEAIKALGFNLDQHNVSISIQTIASCVVIPVTIVFFMAIWGSAAAIAVLESKSGFEPLRQSANQSTEYRSHSFSIVILSYVVLGSVITINSCILLRPNNRSATNWVSVLKVCVIRLNSSLMILHYVVANTVLYVQYKEACGEEIVKTTAEVEVSGEYATVAVHDEDEKVPRRLAEAHAEVDGGFNYMFYFIIFYLWSVMWTYGNLK